VAPAVLAVKMQRMAALLPGARNKVSERVSFSVLHARHYHDNHVTVGHFGATSLPVNQLHCSGTVLTTELNNIQYTIEYVRDIFSPLAQCSVISSFIVIRQAAPALQNRTSVALNHHSRTLQLPFSNLTSF